MRHFFRLSGGGNDFLAIVEPVSEPEPREIRALCLRGLSLGADGLFVLKRQSHSVAMKHYNADGHLAELCLNGTRCAVRLAAHLGWGDEIFQIETDAGVIRGRILAPGRVSLELPQPADPEARDLEQGGQKYSGWFVTVGVPHFVLPWPESLVTAPVDALGSRLRRHEQWGESGANVNFVRFVDPHRLEIRTFERGVEAETLACGSGVMASVAAGVMDESLDLPVEALTLGGFELEVGPAPSPGAEARWSLTGDARLIAEGTLHSGSLEVPSPPKWTQ